MHHHFSRIAPLNNLIISSFSPSQNNGGINLDNIKSSYYIINFPLRCYSNVKNTVEDTRSKFHSSISKSLVVTAFITWAKASMKMLGLSHFSGSVWKTMVGQIWTLIRTYIILSISYITLLVMLIALYMTPLPSFAVLLEQKKKLDFLIIFLKQPMILR